MDEFNRGFVHGIKHLLTLTCSDNSQSYFIALPVCSISIFYVGRTEATQFLPSNNPLDTDLVGWMVSSERSLKCA